MRSFRVMVKMAAAMSIRRICLRTGEALEGFAEVSVWLVFCVVVVSWWVVWDVVVDWVCSWVVCCWMIRVPPPFSMSWFMRLFAGSGVLGVVSL